MEVPLEQQFSLFLKILTFDKNLKERAGDEFVIAVLYQKKFKSSLTAKDEIESVMGKSLINKIGQSPVKYLSIDIDSESDIPAAINKSGADFLYVAPLRAFSLESIIDASRALGKTTLTGVPGYVESGLAIGIGARGGKPEIIINLPAAKAEGANFNAQLLKLAKIIE